MTRFVAIGDSTVEGLEDPGADGGYVGWADRLAEHLGTVHPDLSYANLAVRGLTAGEVRATQLGPAVALRPDIAVVVAGVNDLLRPRFRPDQVREDLFAMHEALVDAGARVATFTMPDMTRVAPLAVLLRPRIEALNAIVRETGQRFGTAVADVAAGPLASDPALWHDDRLHANSEGHRRLALALAESLGVAAGDWRAPLPETQEPSRLRVVVGEARWVAGHLAPWLWGRVRPRPPEEPRVCKRPELLPVRVIGMDPGTTTTWQHASAMTPNDPAPKPGSPTG
jgi:lysophospholipase L1-like esterase